MMDAVQKPLAPAQGRGPSESLRQSRWIPIVIVMDDVNAGHRYDGVDFLVVSRIETVIRQSTA
jgi:hypothetical protein